MNEPLQLPLFATSIPTAIDLQSDVRIPVTTLLHLDIPERIGKLDNELFERFGEKIKVTPSLNRQIVSFQQNKQRPFYRWYKYKEAFSAGLVESVLDLVNVRSGRILDPFAGSGTTLFAATELGLDADGIELLPVGQELIEARICLQQEFRPEDVRRLQEWESTSPWRNIAHNVPIPTLKITEGAYPTETATFMSRYMAQMEFEREPVRRALRFILFCVLEAISFTRKDGQYLRWDYRSGRQVGAKPFSKGRILPFDEAISAKFSQILQDLTVSLGIKNSVAREPAVFWQDPASHFSLLLLVKPMMSS